MVMMYVRFPRSLCNVEDLLFERGIDICHETVRHWWNLFGPMFAASIRRQRISRMRGFRDNTITSVCGDWRLQPTVHNRDPNRISHTCGSLRTLRSAASAEIAQNLPFQDLIRTAANAAWRATLDADGQYLYIVALL